MPYTSSQTINIPSNAKDVRVTVAGAAGGSGQSGRNSGSGGAGRTGVFAFPDYQARSLTLTLDNNGGSGGNGGTTSYTYTVPQTCTGTATATSTINPDFDVFNNGNSVRVIVSGVGSAVVGIRNWVSDDPSTSGTSYSNFSCNGITYSFPSDGNRDQTKYATFSPGTYSVSLTGLQETIQQPGNNKITLRDGGGSDTNSYFELSVQTQNTYTYSYTYDCSYTATGYYYGGFGGSGGRSATVFDSYSGSYVIVAAGGGGGGGGDTSGLSGSNGSAGGSWSAGSPSPSSGGTGTTDNRGGGGGGGGGSSGGGGGGSRTGGSGGGSVYRSSVVSLQSSGTNSGSAYVDITYTLVFPVINTFTGNKSSMINNGTDSVTLSWTSTNGWSATISAPGETTQNVAVNGTLVVRPTTTKMYTLTVYGPGTTSITSNFTITVYQPPNLSFSLDRNPIIVGETTVLRWATTGDASTITWNSGGIVNGNLNSNATVGPSQNTTYSATVSGLGGTDTDSITLIVYQLPTVSITVPNTLLYNTQGTISYASSYSNVSLRVTPSYLYDFDGVITGTVVNLPKPASAQFGAANTSVSGSFTTAIPYNTRGPRTATYLIEAVGSGGSVSESKIVSIIIDETPDNVVIPETEDVIKNEDPVITPDSTVTSDVITISDIDIPVEVKSSRPIQVKINNSATWNNLRQIT